MGRDTQPSAARRRARTVGLVLAGMLTATPGVHALERFLPPRPSKIISHGLALVILAIAFREWRALRRIAPNAVSSSTQPRVREE